MNFWQLSEAVKTKTEIGTPWSYIFDNATDIFAPYFGFRLEDAKPNLVRKDQIVEWSKQWKKIERWLLRELNNLNIDYRKDPIYLEDLKLLIEKAKLTFPELVGVFKSVTTP